MGVGRRRPNKSERKEDDGRGPGDFLRDVETEAVVQSALLALAPATGLRVDVDADDGTLYLRGRVASLEQKEKAERLVRRMGIPGVRRVRNQLVVDHLLQPLPHP